MLSVETLNSYRKQSSNTNNILTYWNKITQQDLRQNPSRKRQNQLQQYLLQSFQEKVIP